LRTTEFLWQEGHTAHATRDDARAYTERILHEVYEDFMVNVLAIPVVVGLKTAKERFAGADNSLTCEGMMRDGKALQLGTSHELGQNFARVFEIEFLDAQGERQTAWTTSWGASTRMLGGLIMAHGDDDGLRVPPRLAHVQCVVLAVRDDGDVLARCRTIAADLRAAGVRVHVDDRPGLSFGRRATDWELKGVPVRLELGPRDLANSEVTLKLRASGGRSTIGLDDVATAVVDLLEAEQRALLGEATAARDERIAEVASLEEAREAADAGWAMLPWDLVGAEGEAELATSGVTVRCLTRDDGSVPGSEDEQGLVAYVARAY
jgi:prolyl-tRNA synthetase